MKATLRPYTALTSLPHTHSHTHRDIHPSVYHTLSSFVVALDRCLFQLSRSHSLRTQKTIVASNKHLPILCPPIPTHYTHTLTARHTLYATHTHVPVHPPHTHTPAIAPFTHHTHNLTSHLHSLPSHTAHTVPFCLTQCLTDIPSTLPRHHTLRMYGPVFPRPPASLLRSTSSSSSLPSLAPCLSPSVSHSIGVLMMCTVAVCILTKTEREE